MTLLEYFALTKDVASAIARVKDAIGESPNELEFLTSRLSKACDTLAKAKCSSAGASDLREAARLIEQGKRLFFALKIARSREEFPRLFTSQRQERQGHEGALT